MLIVLHQETSTPGRVGNALRALGYRLDIRRPRFGDPLPETLDRHAGAVIFGGPMSANDPDDYVRREIDWIAVPLREQRPFLGICLGAQMLAKQLGARVAPHPQGRVADRLLPDPPDGGGLKVCPDWPDHVYHWHREGFELPSRRRIAGGRLGLPGRRPSSFGHAFGFQFHPDVTYAMMHRWTTRGHERLDMPGARPRHHHFADRAVLRRGRARLAEAFSRWLAGARAISPMRKRPNSASGDAGIDAAMIRSPFQIFRS